MVLKSEKDLFRGQGPKRLNKLFQHIPEEGKVWNEFKCGSKLAFSRIYKHYVNVLYNYGCKFINDKVFVEDCIQDLFFELWESKERLSDTDSIKFYLMKALRIKIFKEIKKQKKIFEGKDPSVNYNFIIVSSYEEELVKLQFHQEQKEKITNVLAMLSERQKEAIFLRYFDALNFEDIATIMCINLQSVHNLIHKAIKILRENLIVKIILFFPLNHFS